MIYLYYSALKRHGERIFRQGLGHIRDIVQFSNNNKGCN